jgi:CheY-like chemotaxis protein
MIGFAELLHRRSDVPEFAKADLKSIMDGGHRATHLIRQILDFSRRSLMRRQATDIAPVLKETVRFLQRTIPEGIRIALEIGTDQYSVHADANQIQQALANLAVNARDAMPQGGQLRFGLSRITLGDEEREGTEAGDWVALSVSDTGVGIRPEVLPHLYEPFFTTKEVGEGTGLGLAQVYGIVKQHEGFIDVDTKVGCGTTFTIYLPCLTELEEEAGAEASRSVPRGHGETVLVVEDEPQVLGVCKAMLEHLGYQVLTASTGSEALEQYDQHGERIELVLADMMMPQIGGVDLYHMLRARNPAVRVVVMTGYPVIETQGEELLDLGITDWMQKPVEFAQLAQLLNRALQ